MDGNKSTLDIAKQLNIKPNFVNLVAKNLIEKNLAIEKKDHK
jgi:predicted transcriptional regulator